MPQLTCLQGNPEAILMGDQLRNLGEVQFSRATAVGAKPSFGDWKVAPELLSGSLAAAAAELALELPTSQSTPPMFTNGLDKTGAIAPLNGNSLEVKPIRFCLVSQLWQCLFAVAMAPKDVHSNRILHTLWLCAAMRHGWQVASKPFVYEQV